MIENSVKERTVLLGFYETLELQEQFEAAGARVVRCPKLEIQPAENHAALDEAIENLYGYDWLVFINPHAVEFFLHRLTYFGHEVSEIDSLRVCAIGEATAAVLESSTVHIDVLSSDGAAAGVVASLATYLGGREYLGGLNFLNPQASIGRDYLKSDLEDAGARADVVDAYRTVVANDSGLLRLRTILQSGGIDCVVFSQPSEVEGFASLFDTNDLSRLLGSVTVACLDNETAQTAAQFGVRATIVPEQPTFAALLSAIAAGFSA